MKNTESDSEDTEDCVGYFFDPNHQIKVNTQTISDNL